MWGDQQISYDECDEAYHTFKCLGLKAITEDEEWFCPECKNNDNINGNLKYLNVESGFSKMNKITYELERVITLGISTYLLVHRVRVIDSYYFARLYLRIPTCSFHGVGNTQPNKGKPSLCQAHLKLGVEVYMKFS